MNLKKIILIFLFFSISITIYSESNSLTWDNFKYNGIPFKNNKKEIIKTFGKPKINIPSYECGYFSSTTENPEYYQLIYKNITFIGNDKEEFIFESIVLTKNNYITIGNFKITNKTTRKEFIKHFRGHFTDYSEKEVFNLEVLQLISEKTDDCAYFYFKNDKIVKYEYWSPC